MFVHSSTTSMSNIKTIADFNQLDLLKIKLNEDISIDVVYAFEYLNDNGISSFDYSIKKISIKRIFSFEFDTDENDKEKEISRDAEFPV